MHIPNGIPIDNPISIFIVDDHPIVIDGILSVIEKQSNYRICGYGSSIQEALKAIQSYKPAVLISDISLNKESGIELVKKVKKIRPAVKILMMSMHDEMYYIEQSFRA